MKEPDLVILCAAASHEGRVCKVAGYVRLGDGWTRGVVRHEARENRSAWLEGDTPLEVAANRAEPIRLRDDLRCDLCGLEVVIRSEKRDAMLDGLHGAGFRSVDLAHLARTLS